MNLHYRDNKGNDKKFGKSDEDKYKKSKPQPKAKPPIKRGK